jgi:hypothetical protein
MLYAGKGCYGEVIYMDWAIIPVIIISVIIITAVSIIIHEIGHLVGGLITGYRFYRLEVKWFSWYMDGKKLKFQIVKGDKKYAGSCSMIPSPNFNDSISKFQ